MGSRHIGLQVRDLGGSRNRENVLALSVQPCEREGGGRDAQPTSLLLERRQQLHVLLQVLALQIRGQGLELGARPLGVADLVPVLLLLHQPARQTAAQRRVRHDRDAEVATQRHEICFEVAHDQRPLLLDGSQRVDAVCHPDFLGGRLRQPEVLNLPFLHQLLAGGHPALERVHARHSVQVVEVDGGLLQTIQARLDCASHHLLRARLLFLAAQREILRRKRHLVATDFLQELPKQDLVMPVFAGCIFPAVCFRRVKVCDAELKRLLQNLDAIFVFK
mmetsp:Transcript_38084/g.77032  ORF Transcript_38084/g.77032 Transcript_38084/m.77032 type:complete len:277 (-) Transcript_38084:92-922(-)